MDFGEGITFAIDISHKPQVYFCVYKHVLALLRALANSRPQEGQ